MSYIARRVKSEGPYMENLNSTVFSLRRRSNIEAKLDRASGKLCMRHWNLETYNIGKIVGSLQNPFKFGVLVYFLEENKK